MEALDETFGAALGRPAGAQRVRWVWRGVMPRSCRIAGGGAASAGQGGSSPCGFE